MSSSVCHLAPAGTYYASLGAAGRSLLRSHCPGFLPGGDNRSYLIPGMFVNKFVETVDAGGDIIPADHLTTAGE